jgi:hypothetical protein
VNYSVGGPARQAVFTRVARHLLAQNAKATVSGFGPTVCRYRYRTPDGLRCAIGCLIADDKYNANIEGLPAAGPRVLAALEASGVSGVSHMGPFLNALQDIHDAREPHEWREALAKFAKVYNLTMPTPITGGP